MKNQTDVRHRGDAEILPVHVIGANKLGKRRRFHWNKQVYSPPADGYILIRLSESVVAASVQGGWDQKMDVWSPFTFAGLPDVISVSAGASDKTLRDLIETATADPGIIKASVGDAKSAHHSKLLAPVVGTGAKAVVISCPGWGSAQTAAMTDEVIVVVTPLAKRPPLFKAGKLRGLGMLMPEQFAVNGVGEIPSACGTYAELSINQANGMGTRAKLKEGVKRVLTGAINKEIGSHADKTWAKDNFCAISWGSGAGASKEFPRLESLLG